MFSWLKPPRSPLVVAHRGSSASAPENTLAAFAGALRDGADAIELDVQLSRDGHVVVIHDFTLDRTTGRRGRVASATLAELRLLTAGGRRSRERIPLLEEVFALVRGAAGINVELKVPRRGRRGRELLECVVETIRSFHAEPYTLVSSFNHRLIAQLAAGHPDIAAGLLLTPLQALRPPVTRAPAFFIAGKRSVTPRFVARCHERGIRVGVFTVNGAHEARRAVARGADMLITDDPLRLRTFLT